MIDPVVEIGIMLIWGICWTVAYVAMVRKGLAEKTYGMPAFALFFNISWEFIFSFVMPFLHEIESTVQLAISVVWFFLDVAILYTYLKYGGKHWPKSIDRKWFLPWTFLGLAISFAFVLLISLQLADYIGMYAAFLSNLMMSILFIDMLVKRNSAEGQSMLIAVSKWIGTLAPTIYFYWTFQNTFILYLGISCTIFDLAYIALLYHTIKASKNVEVPVPIAK